MIKKMSLIFLIAFLAGGLGCTTVKVDRIEVEKQVDLSGEWNDYDAMLVAKEMVMDCLKGSWLKTFTETMRRDPVVIVGNVLNQSDEHVNTQVFTKYLEREVLNSGEVVFVASPEERNQIRAERDDQAAGNTDRETIKKHGKERGADFMLIGSLNSVKDEVKGKSVAYYQANLELVDLETNEKVWIGRKEIKKFIKIKKYSF